LRWIFREDWEKMRLCGFAAPAGAASRDYREIILVMFCEKTYQNLYIKDEICKFATESEQGYDSVKTSSLF